MEMDKLGVVTSFVHNIVVYNIPLLYGTVGEIMVEKSGSLNLGVEGIMAVGAIFGYIIGCYTNSLLIGILTAFLAGALCGLLFAALTVSLQANQNITGLTLTTFGLGVYFFVGNGLKAVRWPAMNDYSGIKNGFANLPIPGLSKLPLIGEGLFDHNLLVYLGVVIAIVAWWYLNRTTPGLRLRAVGENPATSDAAGINVTRYKYLATCIGAGISGLGGLYYTMDYVKGTWASEGTIEALGWLAVALVIFAVWRSLNAIWGAYLFGFLTWLYLYIPGLSRSSQELFKMLPYLATILVLVVVSLRKKRENQPPAHLGLSYFREER